MTDEQKAMIAQFKAANDGANALDQYDPENFSTLADLDATLKLLTRKLEASGMRLNEVGQWVKA